MISSSPRRGALTLIELIGVNAKQLFARQIVPFTVGLVLLLAAFLKSHQLASAPVADKDVWTSRWFLIAVIEFELFLGLWLVSGLYAKPARLLALGCFTIFMAVSGVKALGGESDCGCFGVPVHPGLTAGFDLVVLAALWVHPPTHETSTFLRLAGFVLFFVLVGVGSAAAMWSYLPATLAEDGMILGDSDVVLLEPEKWIGKRFPLFPYLEINGDLTGGDWLVVLYHHDCGKCKEIIPHYERLAEVSAETPGLARVALIEVPPYAAPGWDMVRPDSSCHLGKLRAEKSWFVTTPAIVQVSEGRVVSANLSERWALGAAENNFPGGTP